MKIPMMLMAFVLGALLVGGAIVLFDGDSNEVEAAEWVKDQPDPLERMEDLTANVGKLTQLLEAQQADLYAANQEVEELAAWKAKIITAAEEQKKQDEKAEKKRRRLARANWGAIYARPIPTEDDEREISRTSDVILHFMKKAPRRKLATDETMRMELAADIYYVAKQAGIPHFLWALQSFEESSYRIDAKGKKGEIGMGQTHGKAAEGCDLMTQHGQLECGANWLSKSRAQCESWEEALTKYASGYCQTSSADLQKKVAERLRDWMNLEANY